MELYRIRRKSDGKMFTGLNYPWIEKGHIGWSEQGVFFRNIDTIKLWLDVICSDWEDHKEKYTQSTWTVRRLQPLVNVDKTQLDLYEVVVNSVSLNGEKVIQATELKDLS